MSLLNFFPTDELAHKLSQQTGDSCRNRCVQVGLLDTGCCGVAGAFDSEKEKHEVLQTLSERVLLPAVRDAAAESLIVTDGFSCREQIAQNTQRRACTLPSA